jgi:hypothetical protein
MAIKKERLSVDGVWVEEFVDKRLVTALRKELGEQFSPVGLVFISESGVPVLVNHETRAEIQNRVVHIQSPDEQLMDKFVKVIEEAKSK